MIAANIRVFCIHGIRAGLGGTVVRRTVLRVELQLLVGIPGLFPERGGVFRLAEVERDLRALRCRHRGIKLHGLAHGRQGVTVAILVAIDVREVEARFRLVVFAQVRKRHAAAGGGLRFGELVVVAVILDQVTDGAGKLLTVGELLVLQDRIRGRRKLRVDRLEIV